LPVHTGVGFYEPRQDGTRILCGLHAPVLLPCASKRESRTVAPPDRENPVAGTHRQMLSLWVPAGWGGGRTPNLAPRSHLGYALGQPSALRVKRRGDGGGQLAVCSRGSECMTREVRHLPVAWAQEAGGVGSFSLFASVQAHASPHNPPSSLHTGWQNVRNSVTFTPFVSRTQALCSPLRGQGHGLFICYV
jgi:hypothetical protein